MRFRQAQFLIPILIVSLAVPSVLFAQQEPSLSKEEAKQFLLSAKVVNFKHTTKGITRPWRLTLDNGKLTHDAAFQAIDEHKTGFQSMGGVTQLNFVDSYKYNIAAYVLAEMLGVEDMIPVTVERKWQGQTGSLTWWVPVMMDEADRLKRNASPPDLEAWNKQLRRVRVFTALIYDTDLNQTNVLIGPEWNVWRIDFTRAFRPSTDLPDPQRLVRCPQQLLENLKKLDAKEVEEKTKRWLTKSEIQAVVARRDKLVSHFEKLIADKGEGNVFE